MTSEAGCVGGCPLSVDARGAPRVPQRLLDPRGIPARSRARLWAYSGPAARSAISALPKRLCGIGHNLEHKYQVLCWGERREAFKTGGLDASYVRNISVSDVFSNVRAHCIEYVSGNIGKDMLLGGASSGGSDDDRQARELAAPILRPNAVLWARILRVPCFDCRASESGQPTAGSRSVERLRTA
jgi:hypothetical protein